MDALIPILFAIAYFIFQAYTGYQKEQEKASKRNIGKPNPDVYKPEKADYSPSRDGREYRAGQNQPTAYEKPAYEKTVYEKPVQEKRAYEQPYIEKPYVQTYAEPVYESTYKEQKYVPTERPPNLLAEYRSLAYDDEDMVIRRAREARQAKRAGIRRLKTEQLEEDSVQTGNRIRFDIREAVIMKAILDRPHT